MSKHLRIVHSQPNDNAILSSKKYQFGGEPPMSDLEKRVKKLEEITETMRVDLAVIKSNYATKSDVFEAINAQTKWMAGTIIGALVIGIGAMSAILKWLILP